MCRRSDYIEVPTSQEDDVHNVQCVIDSLSLDYLQISLSHITGAANSLFHCVCVYLFVVSFLFWWLSNLSKHVVQTFSMPQHTGTNLIIVCLCIRRRECCARPQRVREELAGDLRGSPGVSDGGDE